MRAVWIVIRLAGATAIGAAIVAQLALSLEVWAADPAADIAFLTIGFFSFFTIESNILAAIVLLIGAGFLLARPGDDPRWFVILRLCATSYMTVTLVVYNLLLRGIELPQGSTVPWSNEVLHVVGPIIIVLDWLLGPGRSRLPWSALIAVVAYPIVWVAYTLLRGVLVVDSRSGLPWYPYPFLNPDQPGGYATVAAYVVGVALLFALVGVGAIATSRRAGVRSAERDIAATP